jgi:hypothetical protein
MDKFRLILANVIRYITKNERLSDWLAPTLTIGRHIDIYDISKNMVDNIANIDDNIKKDMMERVLNTQEGHNPYEEDQKERKLPKHVVVSAGFLGIGTVPIKKDIGIRATAIHSHVMREFGTMSKKVD